MANTPLALFSAQHFSSAKKRQSIALLWKTTQAFLRQKVKTNTYVCVYVCIYTHTYIHTYLSSPLVKGMPSDLHLCRENTLKVFLLESSKYEVPLALKTSWPENKAKASALETRTWSGRVPGSGPHLADDSSRAVSGKRSLGIMLKFRHSHESWPLQRQDCRVHL